MLKRHITLLIASPLALAANPFAVSAGSFGASPAVPHAGKSLLPLIAGEVATTHDTFCWEHERGRAIRAGNWKMSALPKGEWELFNLAGDHTETADLASTYPEKVKELDEVWRSWAEELGIRQR